MRITVFTLSLTMALFSGVVCARADEMDDFEQGPGRYEQTQYNPYGRYNSYNPNTPPPGGYTVDEADGVEEGVVGPGSWFAPPAYGTYFQADALFLARFHNVDRPLVVNLTNNQTVLNTSDVNLSGQFSPGLLATLGFAFNQVSAVEFTYFGLNDWQSTGGVFDPTGNLGLAGTLQLATTDFIFADRFTVTYSSHVNNAEANYKQTIEGLTLLAGFRYFNLSELYDVNAHNPVFNESSDFRVNAVNQLLGGQVGLGYTWQWGKLSVGGLGKIGVFANLAHQQTLLQDLGNTLTLRDFRAESTPTSVLGEFQANLRYQVLDWLALRAGYRIIGVDNLVIAPAQLDLNNSPPGFKFIDPHNHVYLHGFNVGVEIRW